MTHGCLSAGMSWVGGGLILIKKQERKKKKKKERRKPPYGGETAEDESKMSKTGAKVGWAGGNGNQKCNILDFRKLESTYHSVKTTLMVLQNCETRKAILAPLKAQENS